MYKIINLSVFVVIALFSTKVPAKSMSLNPKESKVLSSPWDITATCTIQMPERKKSKVRLRVLKHHCNVNGKELTQGQTTAVTISNHSSITVSAEAGTEINLENLGSQEMLANCTS